MTSSWTVWLCNYAWLNFPLVILATDEVCKLGNMVGTHTHVFSYFKQIVSMLTFLSIKSLGRAVHVKVNYIGTCRYENVERNFFPYNFAGPNNLYDNIEMMVGHRPSGLWRILWCFITPVALAVWISTITQNIAADLHIIIIDIANQNDIDDDFHMGKYRALHHFRIGIVLLPSTRTLEV